MTQTLLFPVHLFFCSLVDPFCLFCRGIANTWVLVVLSLSEVVCLCLVIVESLVLVVVGLVLVVVVVVVVEEGERDGDGEGWEDLREEDEEVMIVDEACGVEVEVEVEVNLLWLSCPHLRVLRWHTMFWIKNYKKKKGKWKGSTSKKPLDVVVVLVIWVVSTV